MAIYLDEKSKIPLFAVICALPFIVGVVIWLANLDAKATAAIIESKSLKEIVLDIHDRVIRIEEHLKRSN